MNAPQVSAWLGLKPLDVVVARDGRPFSAGIDSAARTVMPRPTTIGGAVKTAFGQEPDWIVGPMIATVSKGVGYPWFPTPLDLVRPEGGAPVRRLDPPTAGILSDLPEGVRVPGGRGDPAGGWLASALLGDYLSGRADIEPRHDPLFRSEMRVGLWRGGGRTAEDGFLYASEALRPSGDDTVFACGVSFRGDVPPLVRDLVPLGGERHLAQVLSLDDLVLPALPAQFPDGHLLVYLATPAIFPRGWLPEAPMEGARLVGACCDGPDVVAGWPASSKVGETWALRWAVPAGSVYYYAVDTADERELRDLSGEVHGHCLRQAEVDDRWPRLRSVGFGLCLTGTW